MSKKSENLFRVGAKTDVVNLAGAIANTMREGGNSIILQAMGPHAVNQAAKSVAVAGQYLMQMGNITFDTKIVFHLVNLANEERTAMRFYLERKR